MSKCSVVDLVDKNAEESSGLVAGIGLELRVDVDDEGGSDRRKQTRLTVQLASVH